MAAADRIFDIWREIHEEQKTLPEKIARALKEQGGDKSKASRPRASRFKESSPFAPGGAPARGVGGRFRQGAPTFGDRQPHFDAARNLFSATASLTGNSFLGNLASKMGQAQQFMEAIKQFKDVFFPEKYAPEPVKVSAPPGTREGFAATQQRNREEDAKRFLSKPALPEAPDAPAQPGFPDPLKGPEPYRGATEIPAVSGSPALAPPSFPSTPTPEGPIPSGGAAAVTSAGGGASDGTPLGGGGSPAGPSESAVTSVGGGATLQDVVAALRTIEQLLRQDGGRGESSRRGNGPRSSGGRQREGEGIPPGGTRPHPGSGTALEQSELDVPAGEAAGSAADAGAANTAALAEIPIVA